MNEIRIFGPPGTGKTTTLTGLIASSCKDYGSDAVLVSSFTRAASRELVARNLPLDDRQVGTLHALCYRSLDGPKIVGKSEMADWNAEHPRMQFGGIQSNVDDPYQDWDGGKAQEGDRLMMECNRLRGLQIPPDHWPVSVQSFGEDWTDFKSNIHAMDFTDLIDTCVRERMTVPNGAKVLFLDEVQDFSPLELSLARSWGNSCERFYLAGDDDQSIYHFKGATPNAFLSPALPPESVRVLSQSYRIPQAVHTAASAWIEPLSVRMPKLYKPRAFAGAVEQLNITYNHITPIYGQLTDWMKEGKTIAFLASCAYMIDPIKRQLREWGLPFHNPYRKSRGDWNPLTNRSGVTNFWEAPATFRLFSQNLWPIYKQLNAWVSRMEVGDVFSRGAKSEIKRMAEDEVTGSLPVLEEHLDRWIPNPEHTKSILNGDLTWLCDHTLTTYEKPLRYACRVIEQCGDEALKKTPQILIGTIHSVKGGEADIVILFPDLSPSGFEEWSKHGETRDSVRRMFYVGMTRAKESLCWGMPCGRSITGYL